MTTGVRAGPLIVSGRPVTSTAAAAAWLLAAVLLAAGLTAWAGWRLLTGLYRLARRWRRRRRAGSPEPAEVYAEQVQLLRRIHATTPGDSTGRQHLLREFAQREQADADAYQANGDPEAAEAAAVAAQILRWVAACETGSCPLQPGHLAYPPLHDFTSAPDLHERGLALIRLHAALVDVHGERAAAVVASLARIYLELAGNSPAAAAAMVRSGGQAPRR